MFTPSDSNAVAEQQPQTAPAQFNELDPATAVSLDPVSVAPTAELDGEVSSESATEPAEEPQPAGSKHHAARGSKASKSSGRAKGWQHYLLPEFAKLSLPEAVSLVLQRQSDEVFDISMLIDSLFVAEIPQTARSEARNRIANVLSIGLKSNKWYRGKKGQYSLSREAVEMNSAA